MQGLNGVHHVTGVTADVTVNVDFWCRILGLRFVKKTLNFETTFRYHTYFGDEEGHPGSIVTFLEFNGVPRGRPGRGNINSMILRVASYEALEFWMGRLAEQQVYSEMLRLDPSQPTRLRFEDFEGHVVEMMVSDASDTPQVAAADDIPAAHAIRGVEGARSLCAPEELAAFAEHLGFRRDGDRFVLDGAERSARWYFEPATDAPFVPLAAGVWHHLALDAGEELTQWQAFAASGPVPFTKVFDHYYFDSCYSPSPGGLVELCSIGPGFLLDQKLSDLGEELTLSPLVEPLRAKLEVDLQPIVNPRPRRRPTKADKKASGKAPLEAPAAADQAEETPASVGTGS